MLAIRTRSRNARAEDPAARLPPDRGDHRGELALDAAHERRRRSRRRPGQRCRLVPHVAGPAHVYAARVLYYSTASTEFLLLCLLSPSALAPRSLPSSLLKLLFLLVTALYSLVEQFACTRRAHIGSDLAASGKLETAATPPSPASIENNLLLAARSIDNDLIFMPARMFHNFALGVCIEYIRFLYLAFSLPCLFTLCCNSFITVAEHMLQYM